MGWWFGRKSAPADVRPLAPGWLSTGAAAEEGFARSVEGLCALVRTLGTTATYRSGGWEIGTLVADRVVVGGKQVVGARAPAIAQPMGGVTVDAEARTALGQILAALRQHGLIEN